MQRRILAFIGAILFFFNPVRTNAMDQQVMNTEQMVCAERLICNYTIFLVQGFKKEVGIFGNLDLWLANSFSNCNQRISVHTITAYPDAQFQSVSLDSCAVQDLMLSIESLENSVGGTHIFQEMFSRYHSGKIIVIGYGAGAIAGYHAAAMLEKNFLLPVHKIIQVGSPKVKIDPIFTTRVAYLYDLKDSIVVLGSWNSKNSTSILKHSPASIQAIEIEGGPSCYFRDLVIGDDFDRNLRKSLAYIWLWICL